MKSLIRGIATKVWMRPLYLNSAVVLPLLAIAAVLFALAERGGGHPLRQLTFVLFDLLLLTAVAITSFSLSRRVKTSLLVSATLVGAVWGASRIKQLYTMTPAVARDIPLVWDSWHIVQGYAFEFIVGLAIAIVVLAVVTHLERPLTLGWKGRTTSACIAAALFVICAKMTDLIPPDDHHVVANGPGPKLALFYRSIFKGAEFNDTEVPALGSYCCFANRAPAELRPQQQVLPNIVVVLQESTFPPEHLDSVPAQDNVLFRGSAPLTVHVIGGGTWVEEYALLHGVSPSLYGRDFVQILWLGRAHRLQGRLVPMLKSLGYRSTSILPLEGEVLADSRAMHQSFGFDRIIDCREVRGCVGGAKWNGNRDSIYLDKALSILQEEDGPHFLFVATMQQHSPHGRRYPLTKYKQDVLDEYQRRLAMSVDDADKFLKGVEQVGRPTVVLMFGDHIPSDLNVAFSETDFRVDKKQTFFNLYEGQRRGLAAEYMRKFPNVRSPNSAYLDALLLNFAGFGGDYVDRKIALMVACGGEFCRQPPADRPALSAIVSQKQ